MEGKSCSLGMLLATGLGYQLSEEESMRMKSQFGTAMQA